MFMASCRDQTWTVCGTNGRNDHDDHDGTYLYFCSAFQNEKLFTVKDFAQKQFFNLG